MGRPPCECRRQKRKVPFGGLRAGSRLALLRCARLRSLGMTDEKGASYPRTEVRGFHIGSAGDANPLAVGIRLWVEA